MPILSRSSRRVALRDDDDFEPSRRTTPVLDGVLVAGIFALALAARVWFNFFCGHVNAFGACDASEYLRNAGQLIALGQQPAEFWSACVHGITGSATPAEQEKIAGVFAGLKDFNISGLVFPAFLAACFVLTGTPFDINNWQLTVGAYSAVSAFTCVFIYLAARESYGRAVALLAGLIAVAYPAFIVNSGRLLSETFACFLLAALSWLIVRGFRKGGNELPLVFVAGVLAGLTQLTRSPFLVLSAAVVVLTAIQRRKNYSLVAVTTVLLGLAAALAPWAAWQYLSTGKPSVVVDRVGNYNFFIGNNIATQGWLSFPYPDCSAVVIQAEAGDQSGSPKTSLLTLAKQSVAAGPSRWLKLMLDKPVRLWKFPWNDFRTAIGPFDFAKQALFHQIVLLAAAVGLILTLGSGFQRGGIPGNQLAARLFLAGIFAFHCFYWFFITVPRYNITSMPAAIIFAAAGTAVIARLAFTRGGFAAAFTLVAAGTIFFAAQVLDWTGVFQTAFHGHYPVAAMVLASLIRALSVVALWLAVWQVIDRLQGARWLSRLVACALLLTAFATMTFPVRANGRWWEWQHKLPAGDTARQTIIIDGDCREMLGQRPAYLLVDTAGASSLDELHFKVNGIDLDTSAIPSLALAQDVGIWIQRAPQTFIREGEWIFDCLTAPAGTCNRNLRQWFLLPLPSSVTASALSAGNLHIEVSNRNSQAVSVYGSSALSSKYVQMPSISLYSWEKCFYGVEDPGSLTDCRLDSRIESSAVEPRYEDLSRRQPGMQAGYYNIRLLAGPAHVKPPEGIATVEAPNRASTEIQRSVGNLVLPAGQRREIRLDHLPAHTGWDLWLLRISGSARSSDSSAPLDVAGEVLMSDGVYASPWGARAMETSGRWRRFDVSIPVRPAALPSQPSLVRAELRNNSAVPSGAIELKDLRLSLVRLPANPLWQGHRIW